MNVETFNRKGAILLGLNDQHVTMKNSDKRLHSMRITHVKQKIQLTLQWMILKKTRPPKHKYIAIPRRKSIIPSKLK